MYKNFKSNQSHSFGVNKSSQLKSDRKSSSFNFIATQELLIWGAFDSTKNHKRQRHKRQSVTAKREKSQMPKFV